MQPQFDPYLNPRASRHTDREADETSADDLLGLASLLSRTVDGPLSPPLAAPAGLPFGELAPPVFERLVAEVAWLIDGLRWIRIYGRSGQDQGGLDLVGQRNDGLAVYQVRRVQDLSAGALEKAVVDFAGPSRRSRPKNEHTERRFEASRFVLACGCNVADTALVDKLTELRKEYEGDLDIDLYDAEQLSRMLRDRGSVVAGVFGSAWREAFCGDTEPGAATELPDAYALLNDPLAEAGLASLLQRAQDMHSEDPGAAAELYESLAVGLQRVFPAHAAELRRQRRTLLEAAGQASEAFRVSAELMLSAYESGDFESAEDEALQRLSATTGGAASDVAFVLRAITQWTVHGYDLEPIAGALERIHEAQHELFERLVLAVCEQIVADEHPDDTPSLLTGLITRAIETSRSSELRLRLECGAADLKVREGTDPVSSFRDLERRAGTGRIPESLAHLVYMRQGRAFAFSGDPQGASDSYRRAVIAASKIGKGGDVRHSLRAISWLAFNEGTDLKIAVSALKSARVVGADTTLIGPGPDRAVAAFEALVDGKLRQALKLTRKWIWRERIAGALSDEIIARQRYGQVLASAGEHAQAVAAFVLAGQQKAAVKSAEHLSQGFDVRPALQTSAGWSLDCAARVAAAYADLIPDEHTAEISTRLAEVVESFPAPDLMGSQPVMAALRAAGLLHDRLSSDAANRIFDVIKHWVEREAGTYRAADREMMQALVSIAQGDGAHATDASDALVRCFEVGIADAGGYLSALVPERSAVLTRLEVLAEAGNRQAVDLLARSGHSGSWLDQAAWAATRAILAEPVGSDRGGVHGFGQGMDADALILLNADGTSSDGDEVLAEARLRTIEHLCRWGEDRKDLASRRVDALIAVTRLAELVAPDDRPRMWQRLIAIHDDPAGHEHDEFEAASLHPLSGVRIASGGQYLSLVALGAAAALATTNEEAAATESRLLRLVTDPSSDHQRERFAARAIEELGHEWIAHRDVYANHASMWIRLASLACWSVDDERDPSAALRYAGDPDPRVRRETARLISQDLAEKAEYEDARALLALDPSYSVRSAIRA
jgi:hypothetical protein